MENVVVVKRDFISNLINMEVPQLNNEKNEKFIEVVDKESFLLSRDSAEKNENYKQIIPYAFLTYNDYIYILKRLPKQNEKRLHNKFSVGVGGHINDLMPSGDYNIVETGLLKELNEEIILKDCTIISLEFKGILNDESNEVGKVHLGFVYHIKLDNQAIEINETEKMTGKWIRIEEIKNYFKNMETWSKILLENLFSLE
ncbi:hypothetical protein [Neobacillus terrae]|uniref:hypothetical protein n=1 Tax=Neobacillus terrae TaxID=3034837 RepID=UPI001407C925|nr:hypothetical protein [Neobacillus terrae]NHM30545.1 hypothetical protein [Neobacillus terrae]